MILALVAVSRRGRTSLAAARRRGWLAPRRRLRGAPMRNWSGHVEFQASDFAQPDSVAELQDLVARSPRIRALGTGHSFNDLADTDGVHVSVAALPGVVDIDADRRVARVPAGMRYGEAARLLDEPAGLCTTWPRSATSPSPAPSRRAPTDRATATRPSARPSAASSSSPPAATWSVLSEADEPDGPPRGRRLAGGAGNRHHGRPRDRARLRGPPVRVRRRQPRRPARVASTRPSPAPTASASSPAGLPTSSGRSG